MKHLLLSFLTVIAICLPGPTQAQSWIGIHHTDVDALEKQFSNPPTEFASHVIWGWEGPMDINTIRHDLDSMKSKGFRSVIFEAGYRLPYEYLSEGWFEGIRTGVLEAKKRGMKVWIIDEGKYPSGFAGGKFTRERPEMRMKAIVAVDTIHVAKADILTDYAVTPKAISAVAVSRSGEPNREVPIRDGKITFFAGMDEWDILLVGTDYRTGQTRAVNNPTGGKDTKNSICDYLSPEAVRQFIDWTHEQYKIYIGDEFGKTVLGFRGDEPDFAYTPWTPDMVKEFKARKGYDPTPWLASLLTRQMTTAERRFRADYWDVWSQLFAVNFFEQQAKWCEANGLAHITHLNNDHNMPVCIRAEGSLFRDLSKVQIPGVDAIWNQIWPGTVNDFPKFASSVSHVYGKPRAFSESFAAYNTPPTIPTAKYAVDYQMVRGINFFEFMFWGAGSRGQNWMSDPGMKELNDYTNRSTYLLSQGIPGARVAVYYPTSTFWLNDASINNDLVEMAEQLLRHQTDFDWVDEDAFTEALTLHTGYFENKSGQRYYTLIIPSCDVISETAWKQISAFVQRGGRLLFWGRKPTMLSGVSFFNPQPVPGLSGKVYEEPSAAWSATVASSLPEPEFRLILPQTSRKSNAKGSSTESKTIPATEYIRYTRRILPDGELFFLFNEGEDSCTFTAQLDAAGLVRSWDAASGTIVPAAEASAADDKTQIKLTLAPWESRIFSIEHRHNVYDVRKLGVQARGEVETERIQAVIDKAYAEGGGTVVFPRGNYLSGALFFPSGVHLELRKGAFLQAVTDTAAYPVVNTRFEGFDRRWKCAFLNFNNSHGVKVSGQGTIDGNGVAWSKIPFGKTGRPRLICFTDCDGGSISGLKLQNQASWCLHVLYTSGFSIEGLDIEAKDYIPSSDGIDIDSSSDVVIRSTSISVHDDCISIKSGKNEEGRRVARPSEDLLIEDCHFAYGHGAITMGSEISGSIRNVMARNCRIDSGNWAPFRFKSQPMRGGVVENITFEDITVADVNNIFDVNLSWMHRTQGETADALPATLTQLRNITLRRCSGHGKSMGGINGYASDPIRSDVFHFEDCHFSTQKGLSVSNADINTQGLAIEVAEGQPIIHK